MTQKINAVLLCTSPLQVINAKSALDRNRSTDGAERNLTVLMVHPLLSLASKRCIERISKRLDCQVIDFSSVHQRMLQGEKPPKAPTGEPRIPLNDRAIRLLCRYIEWQQKSAKDLQNLIGEIGEVYCRTRVSPLEIFFMEALGPEAQKFGIEDGIGDYIPRSWPVSHCNLYEIKHEVRRLVTAIGRYFVGGMLTGDWKKWREISRLVIPKWDNQFSILERPRCINTSQEFLKNIQRLGSYEGEEYRGRVLILGTLLSPTFKKFGIEEEVKFYNQKIQLLKMKHNIGSDNIYYKHHPRLSEKQWKYKKRYLDCRVVAFESEWIAEEVLTRPGITAVYSVGSTSLLYARPLFGVQSFLWDLSKSHDVHPSVFKKYRYVALKNKIPVT